MVDKGGENSSPASSLTTSSDGGAFGVETTGPTATAVATAATDVRTGTGTSGFEFEKFGDTLRLYHYNGLRGGTLTPFRVTRLSPEEAVGASIALSKSGTGGGGRGDDVGEENISNRGAGSARNRGGGGNGGGGGDLEDVVRTKYPSCSFNWRGVRPPYID